MNNSEARRDALMGRLFEAGLGAMEILSVYIGDRLGLYEALANGEARTPEELSAETGINVRFAQEWLEQQAATDILEGLPPGGGGSWRYRLSAEHAEVLLDQDSLAHVSPMARMVVASAQQMPALLEAYRSGGGVPWEDYGADMREAQGDFNRPAYKHLLGSAWFPAIPDLHDRLLSAPPARIADIGCGVGWSSIAIAEAYPTVIVDGYDPDADALELARGFAASSGVADRVRFHARDAGDPSLSGLYDLVTFFECLHDLSRPVDALSTARRLLAPGGSVLVMDERVAESFSPPVDEVDRFMYAASVLICLPGSMAEQPSAATGTVMRPDTVRSYASDAGFEDVDILPIEHDFFRFYRLR